MENAYEWYNSDMLPDSGRSLDLSEFSVTPQKRLYELVKSAAAEDPDKFEVRAVVNDYHSMLVAKTCAEQPDGSDFDVSLSVSLRPEGKWQEEVLIKLDGKSIYRLDAIRGVEAKKDFATTTDLVEKLTGETVINPKVLLRDFVLDSGGEIFELTDNWAETEIGAEDAIRIMEAAVALELPRNYGPTVTLKHLWGETNRGEEPQSGLGLMLMAAFGKQK